MAAKVREWSNRLPGLALLVARLYAGEYLFQTGFGKLSRGFLGGGCPNAYFVSEVEVVSDYW